MEEVLRHLKRLIAFIFVVAKISIAKFWWTPTILFELVKAKLL